MIPLCTTVQCLSRITPSSFYNGQAITDIVLFWDYFNGQGLLFLWISKDNDTDNIEMILLQ